VQILDWLKSIFLVGLGIEMEHLRTKERRMKWEETERKGRDSVLKRDVRCRVMGTERDRERGWLI